MIAPAPRLFVASAQRVQLATVALRQLIGCVFRRGLSRIRLLVVVVAALTLAPLPPAGARVATEQSKVSSGARAKKGKHKRKTRSTSKPSPRSSTAQPAASPSIEAGVNIAAMGLGLGEPAYGGEVSYLASSDLHFGISALYGTLELQEQFDGKSVPSDGSEGEVVPDMYDARGTATAFGVFPAVKYFFTETFYLVPSLGLRHIVFDLSIKDVNDNGVDITTESQSITVGVGIGNVWRPSAGFYVGAEWLSYHVPIYSTHSSSTTTYGDATLAHDDLVETSDDLARSLSEGSFGNLLTLRVGLAF